MSSISDLRKTKKIELDGGEWIEIWEDLTVGDVIDTGSKSGEDEILSGFNVIKSMIKAWSFDEEVNDESIKLLPQKILMLIQDNVDFGKKK